MPRRGTWEETKSLTSSSQTSSLQDSETIHFCDVCHPFSGALLWQPSQTHTPPFDFSVIIGTLEIKTKLFVLWYVSQFIWYKHNIALQN